MIQPSRVREIGVAATTVFVFYCVLLMTAWSLQAAPPYPASPVITGVTFDFSTHVELAPGSDNWPITWSDDNHQYTSWGDGGGFGGTNSNGRVSLGFGRVEGSWDNFDGYNVWGGKDEENPEQFGGKSYGIISIEGVLYAWWGPGSNTTSYDETRLLISTDKAATWTQSSWDFASVDDQLIMPTILNFGKDYAGARDNYVYHYFIRREQNGSGLGIHRGGNPATGKIDLARVPKSQMMTQGAYEFFAGFDGNENPIWTSNEQQRQAVFEDPEGVGWNASVSYNEGLGRYLLMTEHDYSFGGNIGIFDAPEPWGPWTTVHYVEQGSFGDGEAPTSFFWNFSNKWLSPDGKDFTIIFTGTGGVDSWNSVRGNFEVSGDPPPVNVLLEVSKTGDGSGRVVSSPTGIDCGSDCQQTYPQGTQVSLTAIADPGSLFTSWGGDTDCADGVVTMQQNLLCVAEFQAQSGDCVDPVALDNWSTFPNTVYDLSTVVLDEYIYTDRSYKVLSVDEELSGGVLIRAANDDKNLTVPLHLYLTLCSQADVYVAYDKRADSLPMWLDGPEWTPTSLLFRTGNTQASPMDVYRATFPASQLILGGNQEGGSTGAQSHYVVIVQPVGGVDPMLFLSGFEDGDAFNWGLQCDQNTIDNPLCIDD